MFGSAELVPGNRGYIPKEHEQYDVLPWCRENGGEVFDYPSELLTELEKRTGENFIPYGYGSYEEYYEMLESRKNKYQNDLPVLKLLHEFHEKMIDMNTKECWSICRYIREDTDDLLGLRRGHVYYWPCPVSDPRFHGVIDDEEFTSYLYPTDASDWEILLDPTGMAERTIICGEDSITRNEYDDLMMQVKNLGP